MKNLLFSFAFLLTLLLANVSLAQTVEVIDFHSMHRCKTCLAIEKSAKSVLEKEFANELKTGKIVFKTVNVDEAKNAKLAEPQARELPILAAFALGLLTAVSPCPLATNITATAYIAKGFFYSLWRFALIAVLCILVCFCQ